VVYTFEDDSVDHSSVHTGHPCQCPPAPKEWTNHVLKWLIYFFTVEWSARVLLFEPPIPLEDSSQDQHTSSFWRLWFAYLTDVTTVLDALGIFPFYLESIDGANGLMSLRLLRLFRVFQLVRLGQYNTTFMSLTNVMYQASLYLRLLIIVLVFGAALFGSLMYWLEKGTWQYHEDSESYRFLRIGVDGVTPEPSPFTSIPAAFWWFMVTATTVGYG
jgi:Ion transport protein